MRKSLKTVFEPGALPIQKPYFIAEAGVNHEGSMDLARRLIEEAAEGGADAIKFQTYRAATIASQESPAYWDLSKEPTRSQFELFSKYDKFWRKEFEQLKRHCDSVGIDFLSTPFDVEAADFLADLMDAFKISSSDITNRPFIEHIARKGKPILLSTGASFLHEIQEAVEWIRPFGLPLCLMHCILNYPTVPENANLGMILDLKRRFPDLPIGYSDHTPPGQRFELETAVLFGSIVIEKHFTHDKTLPGNDHYHAFDKVDLAAFRKKIDGILEVVGSFDKAPLDTETPARMHARRSLVTARDVPAGAEISADDLTFKRPAAGISPRNYYEVMGRKARISLPADTPIGWHHLD